MSWYICCFVSPNSACWHFSCVRLFATLRTIARWSPLSMGFFRQEHWNGLLCPPPGNLPNPGIKPASLPFPSLADWLFTINATWEALPATLLYSRNPRDMRVQSTFPSTEFLRRCLNSDESWGSHLPYPSVPISGASHVPQASPTTDVWDSFI